ncbi:serine/threonine-protein kinase [Streptomyces wuyuanensis]|uniref:serine/threonine-protein kinase n=1 Tax=Streptomyces wuyuanensis TaxID=1196353 RepID=UPI00343E00F3
MTKGPQHTDRLIAGRYRLLSRLGTGGMGRVWLAHDEKLGCQAAVKELTVPPDIDDEELNSRIARARVEARHAARLRGHPHVVTVHDVVEDGGLPWIVMGFVAGAKDLREVVLERGPLSLARTAHVGLAVLDALVAGHRAGILHRDVKPANILLTEADAPRAAEDGQVLLADYGISLQPDSSEPRLTGPSGFVGTLGFLAPERARGAQPSTASDLFSLGATLYYAVEGKGPFDRTTEYSTLTALLFEEPPPAARAGNLEPVLAGLMHKDPERRTKADEAKRRLMELARVGAGPQPPTTKRNPSLDEADTSTIVPAHRDEPLSDESSGDPLELPPRRGVPSRLGSRRRVFALAAAALLVGGVAVAGLAWLDRSATESPRTGPVPPYGAEVGLTRELRPGDCVSASWPSGRLEGSPKLAVVNCKNQPDGQVLDLHSTATLSEARTNGPGICTGLLRDTTRKMTDVQAFAVVPDAAAWDNGVRNTACVLFGRTVSLYGPVGGYRHQGDQIFVENSSIGDCYDTRKLEEHNYAHLLVDCDKPHELQALGYVEAPPSMKFGSWDAMYDLCARRFGSHMSATRSLYAWNHAEHTWNQGFRSVMCLLAMPAEGQKLPPGSAVPTPASG